MKPEERPVDPLSESDAEFLLRFIVAEQCGIEPLKVPEEDEPFLLRVLDKRITGMQLPIKFTPAGRMATLGFVHGNVGRMVVLLIDALTMFEGKEVTVSMLCDMYPMGTYTEEAFCDYVDNWIKPRKVKWAEIY